MITLGKRLKYLRIEMDLSQQNLSDELCIPRSTISSWESDSRIPELSAIIELSDYFNVSIDYLVGKSSMKSYVASKSSNESPYKAIFDDLELIDFIDKLAERKDLQVLCKILRSISRDNIGKITDVIKVLKLD
ncbi:MAG: helix-turn-helix transcriptional regulator [Clostridiaceae bacterium]|nr:helix-turn-helix transcriptional regulator [Clostridiaceae bacterium]